MNHNKAVEKQYSVTNLKQKLGKFSTSNSLIIGVGLGILISWGGSKFISSLGNQESIAASETQTVSADAPEEKPTAIARQVTVTEVSSNLVSRSLNASGTVEAYELIPVMSQATGLQIQEILVDEGDYVKQGQVLARLNSEALEAEYLQAQGTLAQAEAGLAEMEAGTRREEIARAQERVNSLAADVARAQSDLELVTKRVSRNEALEVEGAVARDLLDEIYNEERVNQANLQQAEAKLAEGKQELAQLKTGERPEVILAARAELLQAQGQLQLIKSQLEDATVTAPASGIIAERNATLGELTSSSDNLFTIIENGRLELRLDVPETSITQIQPQQKVQIISQYNNQSLIGTVREIEPIIDPESRQATVNIDLPSQVNLKPGMFLRAKINTATTQGKAVSVKAQSVILGEILADEKVEVIEGLETGDRIVVKGSAYLKDGDLVSFEQ